MDNGIIRAVLNQDGLLTSLIDHASGRDAIAPGQAGNLLELFRDTPNEWDAWDIEEFYRRNVTPLTQADGVDVERSRAGVVVVVKRKVGASTITQRLTLDAGAASLGGIATTVDWQEREKMLKIAFPLDVRRIVQRRKPSSVTYSGRRTPTHPGKRPSLRSAPTAGSTSPSPATALQ